MTSAGGLTRASHGHMPSTPTRMLGLRALAVTLGLAGAGAFLFALAPVVGMTLLLASYAGPSALADVTWFFPEIALKGAGIGFVALPTAAWLLLRRVAIGRTLFGAGVAVAIGAPIGAVLAPINCFSNGVPGVINGAMVGFAVATVVLRLTLGRRNGRVINFAAER